MARLIYSAIASLDGYVEDAAGAFDWSAPDDEVLTFVNDLERPIGTYLYGRRMYETMTYWETASVDADHTEPELDFTRIWRAAEKIVYSSTLPRLTTVRTRLERSFDPADVRRLKRSSRSDLSIGGPTSPARRWPPGSSTSVRSSSGRSRSAAASRSSRSASGYGSSCSTSTASPAARSSFATRLLPAEKDQDLMAVSPVRRDVIQ
jgi:dihydrofolate reductase